VDRRIVAATVQQGVTSQNNNFRIFRAASRHLLAGLDLYAAYPAEHFDFYKYSPTFALLFAPFAYIPFAPAMLLWNALNAGALYVALRLVLPRRAATVARAIVFLDMLGSLQNVQSNALVAALIVFTFAAYERHHTALGSLAADHRHVRQAVPDRRRELRHLPPAQAARGDRRRGGDGAVRRPARCSSPHPTAARAVRELACDRGDRFTEPRLHGDADDRAGDARRASNWPIQLAGSPDPPGAGRRPALALARLGAADVLYLCSLLVFCVIFNHQAESPTFVIAIAGVAIWFATIPGPSRWEWAMLAFIVVFTILASSDVMPREIQRDFFDRYRFKTVPLIVLWIELQRRLWFPRVREARPS
jgi:hypothetical protein